MIKWLSPVNIMILLGGQSIESKLDPFYTPAGGLSQLVGKARQLGCPKIVLDQCVCICIYIYIYIYIYYMYVHTTRRTSNLQAPAGTCKLMNIAIGTNCIKYQMLHVILI